jgi:hypothetical protein
MVSLGTSTVSILRIKRKRDAEPTNLFTVSKKAKDQKSVFRLLETSEDGSVEKLNSDLSPTQQLQIYEMQKEHEPVYCNLSRMLREQLNVQDYVYDIYLQEKTDLMDSSLDLGACKELDEDDLVLLLHDEESEYEDEDYDSNAEDFEGNDYPEEDWENSQENSSNYSYQEQLSSDDDDF